ncbi:hypothetical protein N836_16825 [Leptolyngbya sp. Heron Island J]|uniref:hypothetical protein n=1 Tax=Leptolyngbya sp. Heron Island J TaxID=1385935 RepID=UPI0003B99A5E|nr:hypothetical protein [Leptolyngbya sp. Heron Island J]ESA34558.1 hypothetical protein N836_16825 [Leptolyngbya sp. Heron Island J]
MKSPTVLIPLLALAGVAATAENADAAIADLDISDDLKEAICHQNWYKAIEVSSALITSPDITPEHRQTLLGLRHNFYAYVKGDDVKSDDLADCPGMQPLNQQAQLYKGPMPRFSNSSTTNTNQAPVSVSTEMPSYRTSTSTNVWAVGARVEGNSIKGTLLNNGLTTAKNVILTVRSQQDDQSEAIKTVVINTLKPWSETEFVATFNHAPGNWMIERIEIN